MRKQERRDLRTICHVIGKDDAERAGKEILGVGLTGACEGESSDERHFFVCVVLQKWQVGKLRSAKSTTGGLPLS